MYQSIHESINQSIAQQVNQHITQSINQSMLHSSIPLMDPSHTQSVSDSIRRSIQQSLDQTIKQTIDQTMQGILMQNMALVNRSVNQPTEQHNHMQLNSDTSSINQLTTHSSGSKQPSTSTSTPSKRPSRVKSELISTAERPERNRKSPESDNKSTSHNNKERQQTQSATTRKLQSKRGTSSKRGSPKRDAVSISSTAKSPDNATRNKKQSNKPGQSIVQSKSKSSSNSQHEVVPSHDQSEKPLRRPLPPRLSRADLANQRLASYEAIYDQLKSIVPVASESLIENSFTREDLNIIYFAHQGTMLQCSKPGLVKAVLRLITTKPLKIPPGMKPTQPLQILPIMKPTQPSTDQAAKQSFTGSQVDAEEPFHGTLPAVSDAFHSPSHSSFAIGDTNVLNDNISASGNKQALQDLSIEFNSESDNTDTESSLESSHLSSSNVLSSDSSDMSPIVLDIPWRNASRSHYSPNSRPVNRASIPALVESQLRLRSDPPYQQYVGSSLTSPRKPLLEVIDLCDSPTPLDVPARPSMSTVNLPATVNQPGTDSIITTHSIQVTQLVAGMEIVLLVDEYEQLMKTQSTLPRSITLLARLKTLCSQFGANNHLIGTVKTINVQQRRMSISITPSRSPSARKSSNKAALASPRHVKQQTGYKRKIRSLLDSESSSSSPEPIRQFDEFEESVAQLAAQEARPARKRKQREIFGQHHKTEAISSNNNTHVSPIQSPDLPDAHDFSGLNDEVLEVLEQTLVTQKRAAKIRVQELYQKMLSIPSQIDGNTDAVSLINVFIPDMTHIPFIIDHKTYQAALAVKWVPTDFFRVRLANNAERIGRVVSWEHPLISCLWYRQANVGSQSCQTIDLSNQAPHQIALWSIAPPAQQITEFPSSFLASPVKVACNQNDEQILAQLMCRQLWLDVFGHLMIDRSSRGLAIRPLEEVNRKFFEICASVTAGLIDDWNELKSEIDVMLLNVTRTDKINSITAVAVIHQLQTLTSYMFTQAEEDDNDELAERLKQTHRPNV